MVNFNQSTFRYKAGGNLISLVYCLLFRVRNVNIADNSKEGNIVKVM